MSKGIWERGRVSRYQPLIDYLAGRAERDVVLSFAAIENLIGASLPTTAQADSSYWSGSRQAHTRALHALGWRARLDYKTECVRFVREG
jgi:hypothetical protein